MLLEAALTRPNPNRCDEYGQPKALRHFGRHFAGRDTYPDGAGVMETGIVSPKQSGHRLRGRGGRLKRASAAGLLATPKPPKVCLLP